MKLSFEEFQSLVKETLQEQQWNKDSETPRDYSKEYNAPGSKEQDERNKRKRDKRKHDKEFGECPDNQDLHHVGGIENDEVKCEPPYINRGRKEKSRLKKGEIVIKIGEQGLRKIVQEETQEVLSEIFPALAGMVAKGAVALGKGAVKAGGAAVRGAAKMGKAAVKGGAKIGKSMAKKAVKSLEKSVDLKPSPQAQKLGKKIGGTEVKTFDNLESMIDQVLAQASDEKLKGDPSKLMNKIKTSLPFFKALKEADKKDIEGIEVGSFDNLEDMMDQVLAQASNGGLQGDSSGIVNKLKSAVPVFQQLKKGDDTTEEEKEEKEEAEGVVSDPGKLQKLEKSAEGKGIHRQAVKAKGGGLEFEEKPKEKEAVAKPLWAKITGKPSAALDKMSGAGDSTLQRAKEQPAKSAAKLGKAVEKFAQAFTKESKTNEAVNEVFDSIVGSIPK